MEFVAGLLRMRGIEPKLLAIDAARPNLVARLPGRGAAPALLLHGHLDVVPANPEEWIHPPFAGELVDGEVWGRGALDMKSGVAMIVSCFLRAATEQLEPAGDIILALTCDEETGSDVGAKYLVEHHAPLFEGARFALGEIGGFTRWIGGRALYPIHVAEKHRCLIRAMLRGPGGHASAVVPGTAAGQAGLLLAALGQRRLPVHVTPTVRTGIRATASALPSPKGWLLRRLLNPRVTDRVLDMLGADGLPLDPLLHNTATATIVRGGGSSNVIPTEIEVDLDVRMVPGQTPDDVIRELRSRISRAAHYEVVRAEPSGPADVDMTLFPLLADIIRERDPAGIPVPMLLAGYTDARYFSRLGIQTYGYLPMKLPPSVTTDLIHARNERIPAAAVEFGAECVYDVIRRYGP
jgi:acetylornithine deacetylase/succinyl-diaminopimelate desuccinylase-like protein